MVTAGPLLVSPPAGSLIPGGQAGRAGRVAEEIRRWHEEQATGDRGGEVEYPVVIAGRVADEHVGQHLLGDAGAGGVANEIGAVLTAAGAAERHFVPQDLPLGAARPGG